MDTQLNILDRFVNAVLADDVEQSNALWLRLDMTHRERFLARLFGNCGPVRSAPCRRHRWALWQ